MIIYIYNPEIGLIHFVGQLPVLQKPMFFDRGIVITNCFLASENASDRRFWKNSNRIGPGQH